MKTLFAHLNSSQKLFVSFQFFVLVLDLLLQRADHGQVVQRDVVVVVLDLGESPLILLPTFLKKKINNFVDGESLRWPRVTAAFSAVNSNVPNKTS